MRRDFQLEIKSRFVTQGNGAKQMDIDPALLSGLIHGRDLNLKEIRKLLTVFSAVELKKFFPSRRLWIEKLEGTAAVNE
jgi:hypothetical protein